MPGAFHGPKLAYSTSNDVLHSVRSNLRPNGGETGKKVGERAGNNGGGASIPELPTRHLARNSAIV